MINKYTLFAAAILLGLLGWSGLWSTLSSRIEDELSRNRKALSTHGVTLDCERETSGGFPFRLTHLCQNAQITLSDGTHIDTPALEAFALIYAPNNIILAAQSPLHIKNGKGSDLVAQFATLRASVTWAIDTPPRLSVEATALSASGMTPLVSSLSLKAARAEFHIRQDPSNANWTNIATRATDLIIKTGNTALLAAPIDVDAQADLLLAAEGQPPTQLNIHETSLKSGDLTLGFAADLLTNAAHQLNGNAKLDISDIQALPNLGTGTSWQGGLKTASTALIFFGEPIAGTGAGRRVALQFENGTVKFRGTSLFTLPPLQ